MSYYIDDDEHWEEITHFTGCTCPHEPEDHGWVHCDIDGCKCEGAWEE